MPKKKTPSYIRRAVKNYELKHDRVVIIGPLGLKDRIKKVLPRSGYNSASAFCLAAVLDRLDVLESVQDFCAGDPGEMGENE